MIVAVKICSVGPTKAAESVTEQAIFPIRLGGPIRGFFYCPENRLSGKS